MPQKSNFYAIGRLRVLENRLIDQARLLSMLDAKNVEEVERTLTEIGYGGGQERNDYQAMIDEELSEAYRLVRDISPNEAATGVLLLKGDCHNLKCVIKAKMLGRDLEHTLTGSGSLDARKVYERGMIPEFSLLPPHLKEAAQQAMVRLDGGTMNVREMECLLDAACFADMADYAKRSGVEAAVEYVRTLADLTNLMTLMRIRVSEGGQEMMRQAFVPGGTVNRNQYVAALEASPQSILQTLGLLRYQALLESGLEACSEGSFGLLERQCDDVLMGQLRLRRYERDSVAPVLGYLVAKEREAQGVRLVAIAVANAMPAVTVKERLRELYE